jgi:uncharacterized repeat protein (TIGR03803 family)
VGALIEVGGTLYGTTENGGANGDGAVFSIGPTGPEHVVYSFKGYADGAFPADNLLAVKGTLYGTTIAGGSKIGEGGYGTIFGVTPAGAETVVGAFTSASKPYAGLTNVDGLLYGTTSIGGVGDDGSVFVFDPSTDGERTLYSFKAHGDGKKPLSASLLNVKGTLYGTTLDGGASGLGTVFRMSTSGTENVIHSFAGTAAGDGSRPNATLFEVANGTLYGTTVAGGTNGWGTVFSVGTSGAVNVVHSFVGGTGPSQPYGNLASLNGILYGTTKFGGADNLGTIFSFDPQTQTVRVLYGFKGGTDGEYPLAGLVAMSGTLYGTTSAGGTSGDGTVFSLTP